MEFILLIGKAHQEGVETLPIKLVPFDIQLYALVERYMFDTLSRQANTMLKGVEA